MGWKSLIIFAFMATHAVNALYPEENSDLPPVLMNGDIDSAEDMLAEALEKELKSELSLNDKSSKNADKTEDATESDLKASGSEFQKGIWMPRESEHSTPLVDPDVNDALHSRDSSNPSKRDDYYEGLEKKSQRSTYVPPPRKIFYASPDVVDVSASVEDYIPESKPLARTASRMSEYNDYYSKDDPLSDIIPAGSRHLLASLDAYPLKEVLNPKPMQPIPPWRYSAAKSYPQKEAHPIREPGTSIVSERSLPIIDLNVDSFINKATVSKPSKNFKMPPVPKRPSARFAPKMRYTDESNFKSLSPSSKPWVPEYSKGHDSPKLATEEGRMFLSSTVSGKDIRQQFHEQGTQGPHSYKFGYNTGDKDNPMARYEERDSDGIVRGSYSYIDARGQKQVVQYESHPKFGFKSKMSASDF